MLIKSKFLVGEDFEIKEGTIIIEDGEIKGFTNEKEDLKVNGLFIPGVINAHTHIADNIIKDIGVNKTLDELVKPPNGLKHKYLKVLSNEDIKRGILYGLKDLEDFGVKIFCDFRENGLDGVKLLKECLNKSKVKGVVLGRPSSLEECKEILKIADGINLSGANENSDNFLKAVYKECLKNNKLFGIHVAEHKEAVEFSLKKYNKTELERLIDLGVIPSFIVHGVHLTDNDISILEEKNIPIVLCVRANLYLNVGIPNLEKLKNLTLGLGTDNFMINSPSIFREMEYIFRLYHLEPKEILRMATINNAKILNLDKIGLIEEGYKPIFTIIKENAFLFSKDIVASLFRVEKGDIINLNIIY
ncbi:amidohydrolase family protein [Methanocaldococcus indicus]|uniref:amidohydrolase family protein n=1 Tax=Methanocaldococcus indicus TaxID=213231 RepID=UPI003C6D7097